MLGMYTEEDLELAKLDTVLLICRAIEDLDSVDSIRQYLQSQKEQKFADLKSLREAKAKRKRPIT